KTMAHLLRIIGARVDYEDSTMVIDGTDVCYSEAPYELVSKMRASIYVLGPLLARLGEARVSFPGGCSIGNRPVDLHLKAMEALGAHIDIEHGYIVAKTKKLRGGTISFEISSVGATINALMAAVLADGTTEIFNAAVEPEVTSTIEFLQHMGAKISGLETTHLVVEGVKELNPTKMEMIPDRIEAGTFLLAAPITNSEITVANCYPMHLISLLDKMKDAGIECKVSDREITVYPPSKIKAVDVTTYPYPGFPTDLQAQFLTLMTLANGTSHIQDTIFPDRFMHVPELNRLQAKIRQEGNLAIVEGVHHLSGAEVMATDLRASAALVLAGLAAEGKTIVSRIYHIDRGYDKIEEKLNHAGAKIERVIS
ncbi:MAG TPA: UDP-N-acetylglucosamine 1-carboxyvinyltransferase, partial [Candidatus Cloacimonadota bacterium]|nr:UDP-N-acetylglucosamine 1-carboxyvinyltransferase [Candidatus Cloacimonadota bacterium]